MTLDDYHIKHALKVASRSPCRSKRGVVLFNATTGAHRGEGHNGPPSPLTCPGRERCAGTCGQRSVHAEMRALRDAEGYRRYHETGPYELLHVELAPDGGVVACSGPSCWQCAREILDVGFIDGVWLYERAGCPHCEAGEVAQDKQCPRGSGGWRRYTAEEFYRVTLVNCGIT